MATSNLFNALFEAIDENLCEHIGFVQRSVSGMTVLDDEGLLLVDSGFSSGTFNKVARARLKASEADRRIREAVAYFAKVRRPFDWWVGPGSRPFDLEKRLLDHGFEVAEREAGMAMELCNLPDRPEYPDELKVRGVACQEELADFADVLASNWEPNDSAVPAFYAAAAPLLLNEKCPMQLFLAYLDGQAVATSEVFLGGGIAGLYSVCTRREFQRRGIGSALVWTALDYARGQGIATAALQAQDDGKGIYTRLGFAARCKLVEYAHGRVVR